MCSSVLALISAPVMTSGQWRLVSVGGCFPVCVCCHVVRRCTALLPRRLNGSERRVGGGRKKASADDYLLAFVVFTVEEFPLSHRKYSRMWTLSSPFWHGAHFSFLILLFSPRDVMARCRYLVCAHVVSSRLGAAGK